MLRALLLLFAPLLPFRRPKAGPRVLLVDDDATLAKLAGYLLEVHGCAVDIATRGRAAIELAATVRPDVAVVDLGLPDIDGAEVARVLDRRGIPVVIVSGTYSPSDRTDVPCKRWLVKPFEPAELVRVVREEAGAG